MYTYTWLYGIGPWTIYIAAAAALLGSFILTPLTRFPGILMFGFNSILLFCGAMAANILGKRLDLPLDVALQKPILLSLAGMTVTGIVLIVLFFRDAKS